MAKEPRNHPKDPQQSKFAAVQARMKSTGPETKAIAAKTHGIRKAQTRRQGNR